jgi:hypothetical protein
MKKNRLTSLFLALVFMAVLSCGTLRHDSLVSADETLADSLWAFSLSHPEGFTLHLATWIQPQEGIVVAYDATQHCHDRKGLVFVISHAQSHEGYVGGWFESTDSLYYFDSVRVFPEDSLSAAINFGKENHQLAIYKLSSDEEIPL